MEKVSLPGAIVAAVLVGLAVVYGAPSAVGVYQTYRAKAEVTAAQASYTSAIADAKMRLTADEQAARGRFEESLHEATATRDGTLQQIRAEYPRADIPHTVAVVDKGE